jgi:glycosyltransferase involved in cell wall biosynthesis
MHLELRSFCELGWSTMKVGMIVHAYYLKDARVRRYAELLAAERHEVDVLCLREGDEPKSARHLGVNIYRIGQIRIRKGRISYVYEYFSAFIRFFFKINRLYVLQARRYDLLHVHNMPDALVFCAILPKLFGTKIILDLHDLMPEVYCSKYALSGDHWLTKLLRAHERLSTSFASAIISANHAFAEILYERGIPYAKVTVVMNAPKPNFFLSADARAKIRAWTEPSGFYAIYIGTLAPRYGVEVAVRAIAKLRKEGCIPGLRFYIISKIANEGAYADEIVREINRLGLSHAFTMMQPVPHDQMPEVIAGADVMMYTPIPDLHMDIALSLKIPEAIAVGCPIVASRLSVHERYFGEEALFMFAPGDVDECAARVLEVYSDPGKTAKKVCRAKERLEEISWDKQAAAYLDLVSRLVAAPKSGGG